MCDQVQAKSTEDQYLMCKPHIKLGAALGMMLFVLLGIYTFLIRLVGFCGFACTQEKIEEYLVATAIEFIGPNPLIFMINLTVCSFILGLTLKNTLRTYNSFRAIVNKHKMKAIIMFTLLIWILTNTDLDLSNLANMPWKWIAISILLLCYFASEPHRDDDKRGSVKIGKLERVVINDHHGDLKSQIEKMERTLASLEGRLTEVAIKRSHLIANPALIEGSHEMNDGDDENATSSAVTTDATGTTPQAKAQPAGHAVRRSNQQRCPSCNEILTIGHDHDCWVIKKKARCFKCNELYHIAAVCKKKGQGFQLDLNVIKDLGIEDLEAKLEALTKLIKEKKEKAQSAFLSPSPQPES